MMEINNLTIIKIKDNRTLIENFNFILHKGAKVAIVGEEGNGKSTLLKAIYNKSLVEDYLQYLAYLEQWNGELPSVVAGDDAISIIVPNN